GIAKGFGELAAFMRHDELCIIPAAPPEFYKLLRQILPNLVDCVAVHLYEGLGKPDDIAAGERFYNSTNVALDRNECIDNCFCHRYCCCPDRVKNPYGYSAPNRKGIKYPSESNNDRSEADIHSASPGVDHIEDSLEIQRECAGE